MLHLTTLYCSIYTFFFFQGVAVIVAEVPEEHVLKAIKEICWRQLNPLLALVEVLFLFNLSNMY